MPCRQYRSLVVRYGEGGLPEPQVRLLKEHAAECASCRLSVALLERDDRAVAATLLTRKRPRVGAPSVRRMVRIFAVAIALLVLILAALFAMYRRLGTKLDEGALPSGRQSVSPGLLTSFEPESRVTIGVASPTEISVAGVALNGLKTSTSSLFSKK